MRAVIALGLMLCCLGVDAAVAQTIRGTVREVGSAAAIPGAVVLAVDEDSVLLAMSVTDSSGTFRLQLPSPDTLRLRAEALGYAEETSVLLGFSAPDSLIIEIRLRRDPIRLDGITARTRRRLDRNLEHFLRRERAGFGAYLSPAEIADLHEPTTSRLLYAVPGPNPLQPAAGGGIVARTTSIRMGLSLCVPRIYVDGRLLGSLGYDEGHDVERGVPVDSYVPVDAIRAIEVYRNPHQAPPMYQEPFMGDCAVVLIWTDYGFAFTVPDAGA